MVWYGTVRYGTVGYCIIHIKLDKRPWFVAFLLNLRVVSPVPLIACAFPQTVRVVDAAVSLSRKVHLYEVLGILQESVNRSVRFPSKAGVSCFLAKTDQGVGRTATLPLWLPTLQTEDSVFALAKGQRSKRQLLLFVWRLQLMQL